MSNITESDFNLQIKSKSFKNAYFIYGEEKYLVEYYTERLTKKVIAENNNSFNLQNFFTLDFDIDLLNNAIEALPLMSEYKCVRLFDFDVEKTDQSTLKKLKAIISDVPDTTIFIMSLPNLIIDKKRSSKWLSFINYFEKNGEVLYLPLMNRLKLQRQLIKWAEKCECTLSEKNARYIIDKCGENLLLLKHELEKLCAYVNHGEIKREDIDNLAVENTDANIFELTRVILEGNYKKAFEVLDKLFYKKEEPNAILAIIASVYIDMYRVKVAEQSGKSLNDISEIFDYKRKMFRLENARKYAYKISMQSLRKCLDLLAQTDASLKSSKIDGRILLEELIVKLLILVNK